MGAYTTTLVLVLMSTVCLVQSGMFEDLMRTILSSTQKCKNENKVSDKMLGNMIVKQVIPNDESIKCMLACVLKDVEKFHDGKLDADTLKKFNQVTWKSKGAVEKANNITEFCIDDVDMNEGNECELAYNIINCLLAQAKKQGLPLPRF